MATWTPKATIQFANDLITASLVVDIASETRAAIQAIADALISAALAADPTLAANLEVVATTKVDEAIAERNLVDGDDPRLPFISAVGYTHRLVDAFGRATWLEALATDGGPSPWAEHMIRERLRITQRMIDPYLFAVADRDGKLSDLTVRSSDGQFADFVIERLVARITPLLGASSATALAADVAWSPGMRVSPISPRLTRIAGWGSSTMAGLATPLVTMATGFGATRFNGGYSGHVGQDIAAHQGSVPYTLNPATLAGPGAVTVTGSWPPIYRAFTLVGTVAGVHGTLAKAAGSGLPMQFTPDTASTATISGPIIPDDVRERDAVALFNPCKNDLAMNVGYWLSVQECVDLTHRMVDFQVARDKEFRVLTHFMDLDLPAVSEVRDRIAQWNDAMVSAYGPLTLRMDSYVASSQIYTDAGVARTGADDVQIALGNKGPSISADALHLTPAGLTAVVNNLVAPSLAPIYS